LVSPQINYADMAALVGGYGEMVTAPEEIGPSLQRALDSNGDNRVAILDIVIDDELNYLGPMMTKGTPS
jgi:thiamine pyrophosphate-dependent acetolactate synthase large subunit-like protein